MKKLFAISAALAIAIAAAGSARADEISETGSGATRAEAIERAKGAARGAVPLGRVIDRVTIDDCSPTNRSNEYEQWVCTATATYHSR